ncbi:carbon-nitrogen hydrolase family protein [Solicola gregarius]|uniref:Carbon-nitrogen hydrolase family protein n=1 Tax=Solicola gregarius TaxID=2908642 RepID=A0AA46TLQ0_9ACTN|nr:carbon-nitrogen hydrolase family protein [Solicola gregarius]UYM07612.1 carbon-nitrogen hydrolase family protein [Solicola gregarius]
MRIALHQMSATTDSAENRQAVEKALDAVRGPVDLVVLPEAVMHDFGAPDHDLAAIAETRDGPFCELLSRHAARLETTVVAGMFEVGDTPSGLPYNTLVAFGPDGSLRAAYRKVHLYDSFGYLESDRLAAGDVTTVTLPVAGRTIGLMTCYDLRFPEYARMLVDAGADVLVVPAAWVAGPLKEDHWITLLRARAIENTVDVVAVGQCGRRYAAGTSAVDPLGVVAVSAGERTTTVYAELDADRLAEARATNPSLANRRIGRPG